MLENSTQHSFRNAAFKNNSIPSKNQTFFTSKSIGEDFKLSFSVSQHQSQSQQHMSPHTESASKYLLKLWIEKRLEQIRNNSTSGPVTSERTCPDMYATDPQEELLCSLWTEFQDLQFSLGLMDINTGFPPHKVCS